MDTNALSSRVIGGAIEVHRALGPGLLESAYEECLWHELGLRGLRCERQRPLPVTYKGVQLECGYRLDLLVENEIVVEIKACSALTPIHKAQLLTYMRLGGWKLGLLINFHADVLKHGIKRMVLGL